MSPITDTICNCETGNCDYCALQETRKERIRDLLLDVGVEMIRNKNKKIDMDFFFCSEDYILKIEVEKVE